MKTTFTAVEVRTGVKALVQWLSQLEERLDKKPLAILSGLAMVSVQDPNGCDCSGMLENDIIGQYYHSRHRKFNRLIWEKLNARPGMMKRLRAACRREMKMDRQPDLSNGPWGVAINHQYARQLLDKFLVAKPTWC
jgi:hypothetical protein